MKAAPCYDCTDRRKRREQKARENNANSYIIELTAKKAKRTRKGHKQ